MDAREKGSSDRWRQRSLEETVAVAITQHSEGPSCETRPRRPAIRLAFALPISQAEGSLMASHHQGECHERLSEVSKSKGNTTSITVKDDGIVVP
jgi:hypothetical protein